ncbi:unnamed protein product [Vitrella brassicaformis CCMP3155]|uniref:40S ribosomal protein S6 n=2 Tax=Vitrella brassicaformis TaxID=1169539 RepID=A0A0G4FJE9_VITBC|nr:unnamed protein product [Vitrella brassicaformis CCMP3155]|mmetsp:Transcript_28863/g.71985  ORF Transcript_28863/g.71985 Transcript_28863/m.71985 type:complete len:241 (+) Transcript_28863:65-787(+)|eukprot:CEM13228.1 unnamed protein product [Vitrella brassicaformis CCMP3155]
MKINIANPANGQQKTVEVEDDRKLLPFFDKRMAAEVPGDSLGDEFKGYIFRITGGNDKQGFPMMQGVLTNTRVRLLFKEGMPCFRPRRKGQFKRKSVRGCIVGPDIGVLALTVVKQGDNDIPGLTDGNQPRRLGPKRANKIRKLFALAKDEDVRPHVIRRTIEGRKGDKAPKIQRLITSTRIYRKKKRQEDKIAKVKKSREAAAKYKEVLDAWKKAKKEHKREEHDQKAAAAKKEAAKAK